jgi:AcrR family transcriptional regulator
VIESAGRLFANAGVDAVSLRDIATAADVQLALIPRYFGSREGLIEAVFGALTTKVAQGLVDRPSSKSASIPTVQ